jgi:signal peptidase I
MPIWTKLKQILISSTKFTAGSFTLFCVINKLLFTFHKVEHDEAMKPSLQRGDYLFIWRLDYPYKIKNIKQSESLVFLNHPFENKRVTRLLIAKEREWIKGRNSHVYHKIPQDFCWVESIRGGDDSNEWGPIPISLIIGQPKLKIRFFEKFVFKNKIEKNMSRIINLSTRKLNTSEIEKYL